MEYTTDNIKIEWEVNTTKAPEMSKYLFMSLDGTIITTKSEKQFPIDIDDWKFNKGVLGAIVNAIRNEEFEILCIVTNQGGISEGYLLPSEFANKMGNIVAELAIFLQFEFAHTSIPINTIICPSMNSPKRKPNIKYIKQEIDIYHPESLMVGDMESDETFAENLQIQYRNINNFINIYSITE